MASDNLAILITQEHQPKLAPAQPTELWEPEEGEVRIRVEAAAQNPVDWKQIDNNFGLPSFPFILGVDVAGVVDKLGPGVTKFKLGDRVASMTPLAKAAKHGVYQKYCVLRVDASIPIPDSYSFDEAATTPLAFWTAALGLFASFPLPIPLTLAKQSAPVVPSSSMLLVWGGSSSVGALAVQLGVVAGFRVVATASKRNWEYVKSLGAEEVLDYHDSDIEQQVKSLCPDLQYAYDAISEHGSTETTISCLSHPAPEIVIVLSLKGKPTEATKVHHVFAGAIYHDGHEEERLRLTELWDVLMREGKIKPNPVKLMPGGLGSIDEGFDLMRAGKVSGQKLVYHSWETEA